jgi:O-antigen/teichoic acid export membrane protein
VVLGRFATVWWLTRLLDPASFGTVALIQAAAALGFAFLCGPLLQAGLRFHPEAARDGRVGALHGLLRPLVLRTAWITVGVLLAGALCWKLGTGSPVDPLALAAGLLVIVPDAFRLYETNALNAARRQTSYTIWSVADALSRPFGAAAVIAFAGPRPAAALAGMTASAVLVNWVCARALKINPARVKRDDWATDTLSRVRRYASPLVPLAVMTWIVSLADRYVLAATAGTAAAGLYAAIYGVGSQGFVALSIFGLTVFRPPFFAAVDHGDRRQSRRVLLGWLAAIGAGSVIGVAGLALYAKPIARLCLGPEFQSAASLLPWIGAAYSFQALQSVMEVLLYSEHRMGRLLPVQLAGAVTACVLYAILIPRFGGLGAAVSTLGATAVSCLVAAVLGDLAGALSSRD